jgi:hypothetical protein
MVDFITLIVVMAVSFYVGYQMGKKVKGGAVEAMKAKLREKLK